MGKYFTQVTRQDSLFRAWRHIRSTGIRSVAKQTRDAIGEFDKDANRRIRKIQGLLRKGIFQFEPQTGILKKKSSGGYRGIVLSAVENRIVERALLDTLKSDINLVKTVNSLPTSIGGVPDRSVPHGLAIIEKAFKDGKRHFLRSDIRGFFDHVPRQVVIDKIAREIGDREFIELLGKATTVVLRNELELGEDRRVFPTDTDGVAQGSPLSALFGNILLFEFDKRFNERGLICIRFIDDFLFLSDREKHIKRAFANAQKVLLDLGLECHNPYEQGANLEKTEIGHVDNGFVFLGYDVRPGIFQPSKKSRKRILSLVDEEISSSRKSIKQVVDGENSFLRNQRSVQALSSVDRILRGWGNSFAYSNFPSTIENLDIQIDRKLSNFRKWYSRETLNADWKSKRRASGVCLLGDVKHKSLDELPFRLENMRTFRKSSKSITISTDGSVIQDIKKGRGDSGPGGWAFIVHGCNSIKSGGETNTTNNRMELLAVIEAIKSVDSNIALTIRTDSRYVSEAINKQSVLKSNHDLWKEFQISAKSRRLRIEWVRGHSNDFHNEKADRAAQAQAKIASRGECINVTES